MKIRDIYNCIPVKSTNDLEMIYNTVDIYDEAFPYVKCENEEDEEKRDNERSEWFDKMKKGNERVSIEIVNHRFSYNYDFGSDIMNVKLDNENVAVCITHEGICGGGWYFHYITNKELYNEMIECIGMRSFFLLGENTKNLPEVKFVDLDFEISDELNYFKWSSVKIVNNKMEEVIDQEILDCVIEREQKEYIEHLKPIKIGHVGANEIKARALTGKKVVCINDSDDYGNLKKGDVYTAGGVYCNGGDDYFIHVNGFCFKPDRFELLNQI